MKKNAKIKAEIENNLLVEPWACIISTSKEPSNCIVQSDRQLKYVIIDLLTSMLIGEGETTKIAGGGYIAISPLEKHTGYLKVIIQKED